jgi:hypothetical protein
MRSATLEVRAENRSTGPCEAVANSTTGLSGKARVHLVLPETPAKNPNHVPWQSQKRFNPVSKASPQAKKAPLLQLAFKRLRGEQIKHSLP